MNDFVTTPPVEVPEVGPASQGLLAAPFWFCLLLGLGLLMLAIALMFITRRPHFVWGFCLGGGGLMLVGTALMFAVIAGKAPTWAPVVLTMAAFMSGGAGIAVGIWHRVKNKPSTSRNMPDSPPQSV